MSTKIGIISDTHGLLRPEVIDSLQGCSAILHGGDINKQEILTRLEEIAPVYVVRGNNDKDWAEHIPYVLEASLAGRKVCMAHKKKDLPEDLSGYDLVVTGHTHKYEETAQGKTLFLNPGSCGPRRFHQAITMAIAEIDDGNISITRIDIPQKPAGTFTKADTSDLKKQIEIVSDPSGRNSR